MDNNSKKRYSEERVVSNEEVKILLENEAWQHIGESTTGSVYWNSETGEIIFTGGDYGIIELNKD